MSTLFFPPVKHLQPSYSHLHLDSSVLTLEEGTACLSKAIPLFCTPETKIKKTKKASAPLHSHTHSLWPSPGLCLRRLSISFLSWHHPGRQYNLVAECMQFKGQGSPPGSTTQQLCDLGIVISPTPSFLKWQYQHIHHRIILIHIPAVLTYSKCSVNVNYY